MDEELYELYLVNGVSPCEAQAKITELYSRPRVTAQLRKMSKPEVALHNMGVKSIHSTIKCIRNFFVEDCFMMTHQLPVNGLRL